jgi:hypothetical protein
MEAFYKHYMIRIEKTMLGSVSDRVKLRLQSLWERLPELILDFDLNHPVGLALVSKDTQGNLIESSPDEITNQILTLALSLENPVWFPRQEVGDKNVVALIERVARLYHLDTNTELNGANLQIVNSNPFEFYVTNGTVILSGDLTKGIVRHKLMGDHRVVFEYSGNFTTFRRHGVEQTIDSEEAIKTWGLRECTDGVVVWHQSDFLIKYLFRPNELFSIKYEYSINRDSDHIELVVSVFGIQTIGITEFRLTTSVDQVSREIPFSGAETGWMGTKEFHTAGESQVRLLSFGPIDRLLILPDEVGAPRDALLIELLSQELIDEVRSESELPGKFHWIYLVYDLSDLGAGSDWSIRERRVIKRVEPKTKQVGQFDVALQKINGLVRLRAALATLAYLDSKAKVDFPVFDELFASLYSQFERDVRSTCTRDIDPIDSLSVVEDLLMLTEGGLFISRLHSDRQAHSNSLLLKLVHSRAIKLIDSLAISADRGENYSDFYFEAVLNAILFLSRPSVNLSECEDPAPSLGVCIGLVTGDSAITLESTGVCTRKWMPLNFKIITESNVSLRDGFLYMKALRAVDQLRGFAQRNRVAIHGASPGQINRLKQSALDIIQKFSSKSSEEDDEFGKQFYFDSILMLQFVREIHLNGDYQMKSLVGMFFPERTLCEDPEVGHVDISNDSPINLQQRFSKVYEQNLWGDSESRSGPGSRRDSGQAVHAISVLNRLCSEHGISSISDIPCGDFNWFHDFLYPNPGIAYTGYDIVPSLITRNRRIFRYNFDLLDVSSQIPPPADLIFCKDLFNHLIYRSIANSLLNMIASKSRFLLVSNNFNYIENVDLIDNVDTQTEHGSRHFDLTLAPFYFPTPIWNDHYLGFWLLADLPVDTLKRIADSY